MTKSFEARIRQALVGKGGRAVIIGRQMGEHFIEYSVEICDVDSHGQRLILGRSETTRRQTLSEALDVALSASVEG